MFIYKQILTESCYENEFKFVFFYDLVTESRRLFSGYAEPCFKIMINKYDIFETKKIQLGHHFYWLWCTFVSLYGALDNLRSEVELSTSTKPWTKIRVSPMNFFLIICSVTLCCMAPFTQIKKDSFLYWCWLKFRKR